MNFCELILKKPLDTITLHDIEQFFTVEQEETDLVEFKSTTINPDEKAIYKAISAFLNSRGGLIIWGAPMGAKDPTNHKRKIFTGELTPYRWPDDKDSYINSFSLNQNPLANGIRVRIVNGIMLIEVDPSEYSPHQTNDKYYMRLDGQSVIAPHHYIEALMKKIRYPNIEAHLKVADVKDNGNGGYNISISLCLINLSPYQKAEDITCTITTEPPNATFIDKGIRVQRLDKEIRIMHFATPHLINRELQTASFDPTSEPFFFNIHVTFAGKNSLMKISDFTLQVSKETIADKTKMITADGYRNVAMESIMSSPNEVTDQVVKGFYDGLIKFF